MDKLFTPDVEERMKALKMTKHNIDLGFDS
jgi:hypothetical protein